MKTKVTIQIGGCRSEFSHKFDNFIGYSDAVEKTKSIITSVLNEKSNIAAGVKITSTIYKESGDKLIPKYEIFNDGNEINVIEF